MAKSSLSVDSWKFKSPIKLKSPKSMTKKQTVVKKIKPSTLSKQRFAKIKEAFTNDISSKNVPLFEAPVNGRLTRQAKPFDLDMVATEHLGNLGEMSFPSPKPSTAIDQNLLSFLSMKTDEPGATHTKLKRNGSRRAGTRSDLAGFTYATVTPALNQD